ncbi:hypothetical protein Mal64_36210 [Pseudobythopirellula maris]|uniref:Uncharacterized protein n=1 Tax=Pseudobythopirellula maris TaxID=2527991 RepID=A0A5C5ZIZ6_9BACT|nr:hypothetical protein [Pseudobythopirellula maris]TWT86791.1 hypothetical protein Mal64_36210 [Pseudobythopirellula maris]
MVPQGLTAHAQGWVTSKMDFDGGDGHVYRVQLMCLGSTMWISCDSREEFERLTGFMDQEIKIRAKLDPIKTGGYKLQDIQVTPVESSARKSASAASA